ncbi:phosphotransferase [Paenarthrobacter ureafaciens]
MTDAISSRQLELLTSWLGHFTVIQDHSWPLQDTTVLQLETEDGRHVTVKASLTSHYIRREIKAYTRGLPGLRGRVPDLLHSAPDAGLLVTGFLPGTLVAGTAAEHESDTYYQAGKLLALLHRPAGTSESYLRSMAVRTSAMIERLDGLVAAPVVRRVAEELAAVEVYPVELVTTHGDFQPRNWLYDDGAVKVIDFGRADLRPWVHDVVRLSHQQFRTNPELEAAFHHGFGRLVRTPEEAGVWRLENLNQAVGTVVWAHQVGDQAFEQQGVLMLERVLEGFEPFAS